MKAPLPDDEAARLAALRSYDLLDTAPDEAFDDLTELAAHICEAPIALITLLDEDRQWFKSRVGLSVAETSRDVAFCAHAIHQPDLFIVPDATKDPRFADNALVTDQPKIRFYAGAPLVTPDGHALGTLCVIDRVPRQLRVEHQQALRVLSRHVMAQVELRRRTRELDAANGARDEALDLLARERAAIQEREAAEQRLRQERDLLESFINSLPGVAYVVDAQRRLLRWNRQFEQITGRTPRELAQFDPGMLFAAEDFPRLEDAMRRVFTEGAATVEVTLQGGSAGGIPYLFTGVRAIVGGGPCMVGVGLDLSARKEAEENAARLLAETERSRRALLSLLEDQKRAESSLRDLSHRLLEAEDDERRRIAKELHDSTAQDLVAVMMNLEMLRETPAARDADAARIVEDTLALVENSVNEIRTLSYVLHPPRLDEMGLFGALTEFAAGFTNRTDTRIRVEPAPDFGRLPEELEIVLFRIAQEAIANVLRHSESDTATIRLAREDGDAVLEVEDHGRGMAQAGPRGVGIAAMRERLQPLGGRLEIESGASGTTVRAVLPLPADWK